MITKMMNKTRSQPWDACLAVAAISAANVALAAATPSNHAATPRPINHRFRLPATLRPDPGPAAFPNAGGL